jgi:hypothetical protein
MFNSIVSYSHINRVTLLNTKEEPIGMPTNKKTISMVFLVTCILGVFFSGFHVNAQEIVDKTMCYGYNPITLEANGATVVFLTTNEEAGIWVKMTDPPSSVVFKWYDPEDLYYQNTEADSIKEDPSSDWGIVYSSIKIDGRSVANKPGKWYVNMFIDGQLEMTQEFQILSYEVLTQDLLELRADVNSVRENIDKLQTENAELLTKYNELADDYETLKSETSSTSDLEELQGKYALLQGDYTKLQSSLGTTRMMMYASVVVAIASVAIAVYFGALKK